MQKTKPFIVAETIPMSRSFIPSYYQQDHYSFMWHYHPNFEIFIQATGDINCIVGDYIGELHEGEIILVGANLPHSFYTIENNFKKQYEFLKIHFENSFIDKLINNFPETFNLKDFFNNSLSGIIFKGEKCKPIIKKVEELNKRKFHSGINSLISFLEILEDLNNIKNYKVLSSKKFKHSTGSYDIDRLDKICTYLNQEYKSEIKLSKVAKIAGTSVSNLCAFFKKATGITIIEYVNKLRISVACKMLIETERQIIDIALSSGYQTLSHFNRTFQKTKKTSPRKFRSKYK